MYNLHINNATPINDMIAYTIRPATNLDNILSLWFVLECNNGATFEGSTTIECINAMFDYYDVK
jgi:hypothetical protein